MAPEASKLQSLFLLEHFDDVLYAPELLLQYLGTTHSVQTKKGKKKMMASAMQFVDVLLTRHSK